MTVCEFDIFEVGRDDPIAPDEFKKVLPTKAQLVKCVAAAELMFGLVARVYREQGKGKSVYFIQTFEHSNIQTFLTS